MRVSQLPSWWAHPRVQKTRKRFAVVCAAQADRWRENDAEITRQLARLQTADMVIGAPARRGGWSTGAAQVRG